LAGTLGSEPHRARARGPIPVPERVRGPIPVPDAVWYRSLVIVSLINKRSVCWGHFSEAMTMQTGLWRFQSERWHSLLQYKTRLHAEHMFLCCFKSSTALQLGR